LFCGFPQQLSNLFPTIGQFSFISFSPFGHPHTIRKIRSRQEKQEKVLQTDHNKKSRPIRQISLSDRSALCIFSDTFSPLTEADFSDILPSHRFTNKIKLRIELGGNKVIDMLVSGSACIHQWFSFLHNTILCDMLKKKTEVL